MRCIAGRRFVTAVAVEQWDKERMLQCDRGQQWMGATMDEPRQEFNQAKALAVVLYLAIRTPRPSFMSIAKLMYFADKTYLERYGRLISSDHYVARQHGPVPGNTYQLMRDSEIYSPYGFKVVDDYFIEAIDAPDLGELAGQEVQCLDEIIARFGDAPTWYLQQLSQDRAWQRAWQGGQEQGEASHPIPEAELLRMLFADQGEQWPSFIQELRDNL